MCSSSTSAAAAVACPGKEHESFLTSVSRQQHGQNAIQHQVCQCLSLTAINLLATCETLRLLRLCSLSAVEPCVSSYTSLEPCDMRSLLMITNIILNKFALVEPW
jgi:hypothetical protein